MAWRVTLLDEDVFEATSIRPASHGATDALPAELSSRLSTVVSSGLRGKVIVDGKGEGHSFPLSFRFPSGLIFGPTSGPTSGRLADPCDAAPLMGTGLASRDASKAFVVPAGAGWRGFQGGAESSNLENASAQTSLLAALGSKGTDAKDDENPYGAKDIAVFRALRPREFLAVAPGESSWFAVDSTAPDCAKVH